LIEDARKSVYVRSGIGCEREPGEAPNFFWLRIDFAVEQHSSPL
jgi:hypothetical protein